MKILTKNKKAYFNYTIIETFEAGIVLSSSEVKSLHNLHGSISEAFVSFSNNKIVLKQSSILNLFSFFEKHEEKRDRDLLLNKSEIKKLIGGVSKDKYTIIPLSMYIKDNGKIKVEIALAKGKTEFDKRESIKEREMEISIKRDFKA